MVLEYQVESPVGTIQLRTVIDGDGIQTDSTSSFRSDRSRVRWTDVVAAGVGKFQLKLEPSLPEAQLLQPIADREFVMFGCKGRFGGASGVTPWPLPPSPEHRAALIAELRAWLGTRWKGESLDYQAFERELGVSRFSGWGTPLWVLAGLVVVAPIATIAGGAAIGLLFNQYTLPLWAFGAGGVLFRSGFRSLRTTLTIRGTPTAKATSAAIGLAELTGSARAIGEPVPAPVTGVPSLFFAVMVERHERDPNEGGAEWVTVARRRSRPLERLELEDASGRIPVWARGSDLILDERVWESDKSEPLLPEAAKLLLAELGLFWQPDPKLRLTEIRLGVGDPVFVLGTLSERRVVHDLATGAPRVLSTSARTPSRWSAAAWKTSKDVPFAGLIARLPESLRQTVLALLELGSARAREEAVLGGPPELASERVMVWRGDGSRPFLIADHSEDAALRRLSERVVALLVVGGLLMAGGFATCAGNLPAGGS